MFTNNDINKKRGAGRAILTLLSLLLAAMVLLGPLAGSVLAKTGRTSICHRTGNGRYRVIQVGDPSLNAHLAHGDLIVGVDVDENCEPLVQDSDGDGVADDVDNCVDVPNPGQEDSYGSAAGDACEDTNGDGTPDTAEANFCVSIDGVLLISVGTAVCDSTATTGAEPNVALANGDLAQAFAGTNSVSPYEGSNIQVSAIGDYAYAVGGGYAPWGYDGANLTVIANGFGTYATSIPSSNTSSIATGSGAWSQANYCIDCTSTATGNGANTAAGNGTNNHGTATGENAYAWAWLGSNNTATANGDNAVAYAQWGNSNSATSTGVYTCAGGFDGSNLNVNEVAVDVDLCN
jgi:hypothetical protein